MAVSDVQAQAVLTGLESATARPRANSKVRPLSFRHFRSWVGDYERWFRRATPDTPRDLFVYRQAAKLVEEIGELHGALLAGDGLQRASKSGDNQNLAGELADVLICTGILAAALEIDLETALKRKMEVVDERFAQPVARRA